MDGPAQRAIASADVEQIQKRGKPTPKDEWRLAPQAARPDKLMIGHAILAVASMKRGLKRLVANKAVNRSGLRSSALR